MRNETHYADNISKLKHLRYSLLILLVPGSLFKVKYREKLGESSKLVGCQRNCHFFD